MKPIDMTDDQLRDEIGRLASLGAHQKLTEPEEAELLTYQNELLDRVMNDLPVKLPVRNYEEEIKKEENLVKELQDLVKQLTELVDDNKRNKKQDNN